MTTPVIQRATHPLAFVSGQNSVNREIHLEYNLTFLLHIWFISLAYGFSCMMHNLSKMMVIPDSAGDAS
jgi:hypothetical protein